MEKTERTKKAEMLSIIGICIMILMVMTKTIPSLTIAGYSVFIGIAFFFIVEADAKMRTLNRGCASRHFLMI